MSTRRVEILVQHVVLVKIAIKMQSIMYVRKTFHTWIFLMYIKFCIQEQGKGFFNHSKQPISNVYMLNVYNVEKKKNIVSKCCILAVNTKGKSDPF